MEEKRIKQLELKVTALENKLKESGSTASTTASVSPEDFQVYQKVSAQLGKQLVCQICRPFACWHCWPCLCPCGPGFCQQCGPCIQSGSSSSSAGFSNFL